jgi:hypothetical protein
MRRSDSGYGLMRLILSGIHLAAITGLPDTSVFRLFGPPRTLPN